MKIENKRQWDSIRIDSKYHFPMKEKEEQTKENATERLYSRQPTKHTHTQDGIPRRHVSRRIRTPEQNRSNEHQNIQINKQPTYRIYSSGSCVTPTMMRSKKKETDRTNGTDSHTLPIVSEWVSNELGKLRRGLRRSAAVVFSTRTLPSRDELSFDLRSLSGNSVSLISRLLSSMKLVVVFFLLY